MRVISPNGIITTVAGNGTRGYTGDGGPASAAEISNPRGLAVDGADNLYIADSPAVRKISPAGVISTAASFGGLGVALDSSGSLYVVDYTGVRKVSADGTVSTVAGGTGIIGDLGDGGPATSAAFIGPTTIAIDGGGDLYIGDVSRVRKVSPDGIINTVAGGGSTNPGDGLTANLASADPSVQSIQLTKQVSGTGVFPADYKTSSALHTSVGAQREIARDLVVSADLVYRHFVHLTLGSVGLNHFNFSTRRSRPL